MAVVVPRTLSVAVSAVRLPVGLNSKVGSTVDGALVCVSKPDGRGARRIPLAVERVQANRLTFGALDMGIIPLLLLDEAL